MLVKYSDIIYTWT